MPPACDLLHNSELLHNSTTAEGPGAERTRRATLPTANTPEPRKARR